MPELLSLSVKKVNVAIEVGVRYSYFGTFLLQWIHCASIGDGTPSEC